LPPQSEFYANVVEIESGINPAGVRRWRDC